jgi:hypothetical protein
MGRTLSLQIDMLAMRTLLRKFRHFLPIPTGVFCIDQRAGLRIHKVLDLWALQEETTVNPFSVLS